MADLRGFNANTVEPMDSFDPIPAGEYLCVITASEEKPTKAGNGSYLVEAACAEIVEMTKDRKSVLIFASGIRHGQHVCDILRDKHGVECGFVTGSTPDEERDEILARFRGDTANGLFDRSPLKFLCNINVLTTGFDAPNVDCVVLLRPTMSPGLFRHNSKPSGG